MQSKKKKKISWKPVKITRIKLNPEQAVLACCVTPTPDSTYPYCGESTPTDSTTS